MTVCGRNGSFETLAFTCTQMIYIHIYDYECMYVDVLETPKTLKTLFIIEHYYLDHTSKYLLIILP
jgi:hypothetical protein